jgi:hypothetical protein
MSKTVVKKSARKAVNKPEKPLPQLKQAEEASAFFKDEMDWIFDRHDLRYGQIMQPKGQDFKAHLLALGQIGPEISLKKPRKQTMRSVLE